MLRRHRRTLAWSLGSTLAAVWAVGCSLQNFDYLKGEYHGLGGSQNGGSSGQTSTAGATASTGGNSGAATGGSSTDGGSGGLAGMSGGDGVAGNTTIAGGDGGPPPTGKLLNPGFEIAGSQRTDVPDWTSSGNKDAAFIDHQTQHSGSGRLGHWLMSGAYEVSTFQTISPLPDGTYTFKIWVDRSAGLTQQYIFAKDHVKGQPAAPQLKVDTSTAVEGVYTQFVIPNIPVTSGECTVGIYTNGPNNMAINWANIDDAEFELAPTGEAGASGI